MKIFCVTHLHLDGLDRANVVPVYVGKGPCKETWLRDDSADHIHEMNSSFCELTAQYWVWKNLFPSFQTDDLVGFFHYRRFLLPTEPPTGTGKLRVEQYPTGALAELGKLLEAKKVDAILPRAIDFRSKSLSRRYRAKAMIHGVTKRIRYPRWDATLYAQYAYAHHAADLEAAIGQLPEPHRTGFSAYMKQSLSLHPFNIYLAKTGVLDNYFSFLFPWLLQTRELIRPSLEDPYQHRVFGFLAERFASYYFTEVCSSWQVPIVGIEYTVR